MKALVYTDIETLEYRDSKDPEIHDGEVLIEVKAVGICGSDLHAYLGHDSRRIAPLILGHEAAGIVKGGTHDGKSAVINPLVTCGKCPACLSGRSNICEQREIISMAPRQGAFAQYITIPERNLVVVPEGMSITKAALAEPIATAWHAVTAAAKASHRPLAECRALVYGGGAVGLSAALSLYAHGCRDILLAETNELRRETVEEEFICTVFNPLDDNLATDGSVDVVIDCVGGRLTRAGASAAVRPGGVIVHVGLMDSDDGIDTRRLTLQEITFIGTYTYTMQDFQATVSAMQSGALGDLGWYAERQLSDGASAFSDLINGRAASSKIILRPE
ncbi:MAG: alcohol dehydrogenase catalytic domain-containing protein [Proteobacteria bacterium]|nr:alcohol dehydrogenase catalytic domain-containing protein [Pseudomonadota bacterium]